MIDDYPEELADAIALVTFGRGSWVERVADGYVVARYTRECRETWRPAGSYNRAVLGQGLTRREAIEDGRARQGTPLAACAG